MLGASIALCLGGMRRRTRAAAPAPTHQEVANEPPASTLDAGPPSPERRVPVPARRIPEGARAIGQSSSRRRRPEPGRYLFWRQPALLAAVTWSCGSPAPRCSARLHGRDRAVAVGLDRSVARMRGSMRPRPSVRLDAAQHLDLANHRPVDPRSSRPGPRVGIDPITMEPAPRKEGILSPPPRSRRGI